MTVAAAHRLRWIGVWLLIAFWFVGLARNWFGDWLHLALVASLVLLMYELVAEDRQPT